MDTDAHCPFCGAAVVVSRILPVLEGRLSRAAVFATAVLVAPACVVNDPPPPQYVQQPPPNRPPPPNDPPPTNFAKPPPDDQPPPVDQPPPPPVADAVIRGKVTMAGTPQPHLKMVLHGGPAPIPFGTDFKGEYSVRVPAGTYQLHVDAGAGTQRVIQADANRETVVNIAIAPYKQWIQAKPYGAPPARRRLV
ncbi:MAG: carboxypeptidase regulatory-like domain-containing protein [Deltaproteobacteria bacterium]|nr:carboxypeptidase regulatory-like domain-containing protein [Deltaproteobacteria bacterium]